jgi:hypothetical protein
MKRVFTATCLAATFAVGLAAQSAGTTGSTAQDPQTAGGGQGRGGPRTVTGCLRAGDTAGTYMLTDVQMQGGGASGTAGGGTTTAGSTTAGGAGSTAAGGTTAGTQGRGGAPGSIMLTADSSVDLKAHVGHKIEVTGTMAGGGRRGGDAATTGTATGTTTGGSGTATATGTGSTSGTGTAGAAGTGQGQGGGRGPRSMTVTNVRMISESCS